MASRGYIPTSTCKRQKPSQCLTIHLQHPRQTVGGLVLSSVWVWEGGFWFAPHPQLSRLQAMALEEKGPHSPGRVPRKNPLGVR